MPLRRRRLIAATALAPLVPPLAAQASAWARVEQAARGQTVRFNAWAGSARINDYLQWAAAEVQRLHGVRLVHVKVGDIAETVQRVRAEQAAGRGTGGSADLLWINGENFLAMKRGRLLHGPFADALPNQALVDTAGKPTTRLDFGEPTDGYESPWGMAQLTFYGDAARVGPPPRSMAALADWVRAHPGRFTYPKPPQFHGTTFLKQVLVEVTPPAERAVLQRPATPEALQQRLPALWAQLDALHPHLWRGGRQFPPNDGALQQMTADGELAIGLTFNPNAPANGVADRTLPAGTVAWQHRDGTLGNTHFVAIPFNAPAVAGAQVVANFLLSPQAQARKADIRYWGDPTVLALDRLTADQRAAFTDAARAPGSVREPAPVLPEPHASWVEPIEREWLRRHGA